MKPAKSTRKTYRKNISNDDIVEIIQAIRKHPILWPDMRIRSGMDNVAWKDVMASLKNKTISMIQAKLKWKELKRKYFRLKGSDDKALNRWKFSQYLKFLDQIDDIELRIDGSRIKDKTSERTSRTVSDRSPGFTYVEDSDEDDKRQIARSSVVTSTGNVSACQSHHHNGDQLKKIRTKRRTKSVTNRSALNYTDCSDLEDLNNDDNNPTGLSAAQSHNGALSATTTETSLLSSVFIPRNPNEMFCEYLLAELHSLTKSKSQHLRRLLMQTVYDFIESVDV